jgi:hypothetical protein
MTTQQERAELQRAIAGGWSLTPSCAYALGLLRAAHVLQDRRDFDAALTFNLPFFSSTEDENSALWLLQDVGFVHEEWSGYRVSAGDITEEGASVLGGLAALNVPAHVSPAARELLLHALYQAGESGFSLRDAYFGSKISKRASGWRTPSFQPWIIFAGDAVGLERFETAMGFLLENGLAGRASRQSHKITEHGRALIEASPLTTRPGYLQASLHAGATPRASQPEAPREERLPEPRLEEDSATDGRSANRVTYVIHGNVSSIVGNAGNSTVHIVNGIDVAALMTTGAYF